MSEVEPSSSEVRETRGANRAPDPLLGRIVGAYRILERVGSGTGLPSYLAEHVHLDRRVLFKLFHPPRDGGESEAVNGAIQQARRLSSLKHEGVLPLVEIAECGDGFMYVVLELSGARPLPAVLAEGGPLPWPTARSLGRQVAAAMLAADAASLASAEPAAAQIFVTECAGGELRARVDLVTPEALGWVAPRSPDQVRAVGQLLYAMLAGHEPSSAPESPLPDLVLSFPDQNIPSDADALIMRAVDAEPSRRWPDLGVLHRELGGRDEPSGRGGEGERGASSRSSATLGGLTGAEGDSQDDATFGRRFFTRPSRRALIAGGVGVVVAILIALVIVSGPSDSETVAFRPAEPRIKLEPPPPPTPIVLPPPAVPDPEPESPGGPGGGALEGVAPAAASPENAAVEAEPAKEPSAVGVAPSAVVAPAAVPAAGPSAPVPVPETAAIVPAAAIGGKAIPPASLPRAAGPVALGPQPQKAPAPALAMAASSPAKGAGEPAEVAAPVAAAATNESGGRPCTISLGSIPWSDVQVDGQRAGFTPLTDLPVTCGTHEILFTSPDRGLERRITLNIRPGEKLKRIVDLGGSKTPAGPPGAAAPARPACRVTLGSRPWSEIWIDGHRAGTTPLVDYPIACGTHDVLFLSREANVQHRESLTVQSTLKKVITLVEATD